MKKYEDKSIERISKNVYLGILYKHLDKAAIIQKKYDEVLQKTHNYALRRKLSWVKPSFASTPVEKLIKESKFRLNSPVKEMNNFALEIRREYHIDVDIINIKSILLKMISHAKLGLLFIPSINILEEKKIYRDKVYGYYVLKNFVKIPEREEKTATSNTLTAKNKVEHVKKANIKKTRRRIKQQEIKEEDEFYYRGGLFKVQEFLNLPILINKKVLNV